MGSHCSPPRLRLTEILVGRAAFQLVRLIGDHGDDSGIQTVVHLPVQSLQRVLRGRVLHPDPHMSDAGGAEIPRHSGAVRGFPAAVLHQSTSIPFPKSA